MASVQRQYNQGANDGFVATGGASALSFYGYRDIPFYYALAKTFAIGDHYFCDLPGPTWPNRMMMLSGTSFGHVKNNAPPQEVERSLFHQLELAGLSWNVYSEAKTFEEQIYPRLKRERREHFQSVEAFLTAARSATLPNLAWVESTYGGVDATDEHPPANIQLGQRWSTATPRSFAWSKRGSRCQH